MATLKKIILVGCIALGIQRDVVASEESAKPNVIFILADDLGYGDLSCYGQERLRTPNIDRIAEEGIRFTQHYSGNTVCSPSRAVLLTGQSPMNVHIRGNRLSEQGSELDPEQLTLADVFKTAGYETAAFGKWGLGHTYRDGPANPLEHGFDEFFGWRSQDNAHSYYPKTLVRDGVEFKRRRQDYAHIEMMREARHFIRQRGREGKPFFAYIATPIPHAAMQAPKTLHKKWRTILPQFDKRIGKYNTALRPCKPVRNPVAAFGAMMEHLDNEVGRIFDLLEQLEIDRETLVIFTSDNGAHKEGGHDPDFWDSTGGLRGKKRDLYEGGIRVPLVARWPVQIEPGQVSDLISSFADYLPTFADLLGQEKPCDTDGVSLLPTFLGDTRGQEKHEELYWEFTKGRKQKLASQALRQGDWKAVLEPNAPLELYNLAADPTESVNLAPNRTARAQAMAERLIQLRVSDR